MTVNTVMDWDCIKYGDVQYPVVYIDGVGLVGPMSLAGVLIPDGVNYVSNKAKDIDWSITYYVSDEAFVGGAIEDVLAEIPDELFDEEEDEVFYF